MRKDAAFLAVLGAVLLFAPAAHAGTYDVYVLRRSPAATGVNRSWTIEPYNSSGRAPATSRTSRVPRIPASCPTPQACSSAPARARARRPVKAERRRRVRVPRAAGQPVSAAWRSDRYGQARPERPRRAAVLGRRSRAPARPSAARSSGRRRRTRTTACGYSARVAGATASSGADGLRRTAPSRIGRRRASRSSPWGFECVEPPDRHVHHRRRHARANAGVAVPGRDRDRRGQHAAGDGRGQPGRRLASPGRPADRARQRRRRPQGDARVGRRQRGRVAELHLRLPPPLAVPDDPDAADPARPGSPTARTASP